MAVTVPNALAVGSFKQLPCEAVESEGGRAACISDRHRRGLRRSSVQLAIVTRRPTCPIIAAFKYTVARDGDMPAVGSCGEGTYA